jgi:3-oxoacyl-[acyl-carrier protein] reductase
MIILITGGASGLGKAITMSLAKNKDNIIYFTYSSSEIFAREIELAFPNTKAIKVNFSNNESLNSFIDLMTQFKPEVLINNAIVGYTQSHFHKMSSEVYLNSFQLNIVPVLRVTQKFISDRRKLNGGKIITILTSSLINKPPTGWAEYVANKAYLHSMTKSWAVENLNFGITSNCISPSFMQTNLTSKIDKRIIETMINENPNDELLKEEDVSQAVEFLVNCTPQINGLNLVINAASDLI